MLAACAAPNKQPPSTVEQNEQKPEGVSQTEVKSSARTVAQLLAEVRELPTLTAQIAFLLDETLMLQNSNQWQTSATLLSEIAAFESQLDPSQQRRVALAQARWLASQGEYQAAQAQLTPIQNKLAQQERLIALALSRDLAWQRGQLQQAAQLQLDLLAAEPTTESSPWSYLKYATQPQALSASTDLAQGWLALLRAAHAQIEGSDTSALQGWQLRYGDHPATAVAAQLRDNLQQPDAQRALVLLPLSGQYADQGQAVLDGIVLALEGQKDFEILVRDSNSYDFSALSEELQRTQATVLMGPLLKDNLSKVNATALGKVKWVALNSLEQFAVQPTLWFALEPETEYQQVAKTFANRGYTRPLVLAADSNRGKQAIETFRRAFLQAVPTGNVESGLYRTPDDMKAIVQEKLGVTDSEARIWQVKITAGKILVDAEARSRADIDAIFLAGGIEQTRLLKPFIDVNISPFMSPIPVYATSASHIRSDTLSENDLDKVRFTELPWLLPEHPSYSRLQRILQQRSHWNYDLARLAAFGHDALLLTQHQAQLESLPGKQLPGLTGNLRWDGNQVQRELGWAHYDGHQVKPVTEPKLTR
ncbi:penicillin-binding protein activator [Pseudidiomarina sp.]|uniref:penicillin-binding protein activator n=1 Tax=Pseudidiomarina sp. TaxID=2081707 RepID=UPI003A97AC27